MSIIQELKLLADPQKAQQLQRFFKTGKGEYGEGDKFIGLKVPQIRQIVKKYWHEVRLAEAEKLLRNKYHEVRLCGLLIFVKRFNHATPSPNLQRRGNLKSGIASSQAPRNDDERYKIFNIYISNTKYINNWDLIDLTAGYIVGQYLADKPKTLLYKFAKSKSLWERRISIISTLYFIVFQKKSKETIKITKILLHDKHDLIHKAVGWTLREVGKRVDEKILTDFLDQHSHQIPRTMLRYAIERLPEKQRLYYLRKKL